MTLDCFRHAWLRFLQVLQNIFLPLREDVREAPTADAPAAEYIITRDREKPIVMGPYHMERLLFVCGRDSKSVFAAQ